MSAIMRGRSTWLGTVLHYYFFGPGDGSPTRWAVRQPQREAVRQAFAGWKALGIGLVVTEVQAGSEAEVRIGFDQGDGSWSSVGRDVLDAPYTDRTLNTRKESAMTTVMYG